MTLQIACAFGFGLLIGSFANVMIQRLPRMVMADPAAAGSQQPYSLNWPASHCPHCLTPLKAWHNIPVLSYVGLKGKCVFCQQPISPLYPAIEIAVGLIWAACTWHGGWQISSACWALFATVLLVLSVIDCQTTLLPDDLTQTLVWTGLMASAMNWISLPLDSAVWGAVVGYSSLWSVATAFEKFTGRQGMGAGDFKLLAGLGAWLGFEALLPLVLIASLSGALIGILLKLNHRINEDGHMPFGPFLAVSGLLIAAFGVPPFA
jgi:leader peptidase (prepilin peptidase)/N-methyltransferase